jgi:hypothetical protein
MSVLPATQDASEGKWCTPGPSSARLTVSNGSTRLARRSQWALPNGTAKGAKLPSRATSRGTSSRRNAPCSGSLDSMARGPCSPRLSGFADVLRGKDYTVLDHPVIQARLREQCQWQVSATKKPRQVSVLLHPLITRECAASLARLEPGGIREI